MHIPCDASNIYKYAKLLFFYFTDKSFIASELVNKPLGQKLRLQYMYCLFLMFTDFICLAEWTQFKDATLCWTCTLGELQGAKAKRHDHCAEWTLAISNLQSPN